jgi:hypothetical protein
MRSLNPLPGRAPAGMRQSSILGPSGKPVSYFLYPSPRTNLRQYKPRFWLSADTKSNVTEYDRYELVNYSRQLFAQIGNLATAIRDKNSWAFGDAWDAHYVGKNAKWGEEATEFLKYQFFPACNLRGPLYDFKRTLRLSGQSWDVDGDDVMVLTESERGFPMVAVFPATRIGTQTQNMRGRISTKEDGNIVSGGPFDGAKIFDGVITDRNSRPIGIRIIGEDGETNDISTFNADLSYEPEWADQVRGIPRIATCLLRWLDLQDIDDFLRRGMKRAAAVGLINKKEEGEAGLGNEVITSEDDPNVAAAGAGATSITDATAKIFYEEIEGGEMYYVNSLTGEGLEALKFENPHPNSEAFVQRVVREALASVGWLYELLDVSSSGRAPTRLACDLANQSIWIRQSGGHKRWKRAVTYAVAKAMKNGYLSKNNDGMDPYLWEPGMPKQLTVDAGNEEQADRENLKLGTTSKTIIAQKKGYHRSEIERHREDELGSLIEAAQRISTKYPQVPFEMAMELLEQRTPNGLMQINQPEEEPEQNPKSEGRNPKK